MWQKYELKIINPLSRCCSLLSNMQPHSIIWTARMLLDVTATIDLYIDLLYCILHHFLTHGFLGEKIIKKINNYATQAIVTIHLFRGTIWRAKFSFRILRTPHDFYYLDYGFLIDFFPCLQPRLILITYWVEAALLNDDPVGKALVVGIYPQSTVTSVQGIYLAEHNMINSSYLHKYKKKKIMDITNWSETSYRVLNEPYTFKKIKVIQFVVTVFSNGITYVSNIFWIMLSASINETS